MTGWQLYKHCWGTGFLSMCSVTESRPNGSDASVFCQRFVTPNRSQCGYQNWNISGQSSSVHYAAVIVFSCLGLQGKQFASFFNRPHCIGLTDDCVGVNESMVCVTQQQQPCFFYFFCNAMHFVSRKLFLLLMFPFIGTILNHHLLCRSWKKEKKHNMMWIFYQTFPSGTPYFLRIKLSHKLRRASSIYKSLLNNKHLLRDELRNHHVWSIRWQCNNLESGIQNVASGFSNCSSTVNSTQINTPRYFTLGEIERSHILLFFW